MLQRITLVGLTAVMAVSTDIYLPAIPQLIEHLGASISQGQLTLSFFPWGFATGQLFYGSLSDEYGRKPLLYLGLGIYILATVGCAWQLARWQLFQNCQNMQEKLPLSLDFCKFLLLLCRVTWSGFFTTILWRPQR